MLYSVHCTVYMCNVQCTYIHYAVLRYLTEMYIMGYYLLVGQFFAIKSKEKYCFSHQFEG